MTKVLNIIRKLKKEILLNIISIVHRNVFVNMGDFIIDNVLSLNVAQHYIHSPKGGTNDIV